MKTQFLKMRLLLLAATLCFSALAATAQTTVFTYQGRFVDSTVAQPTNGTYNMQFAMFDAASGGSQVGSTVTIPTVQVVNGIFTVQLDYTAASFDGTPRFLQVTVGNTVLSPRQEITSAPFSIMARKALLASDSNKLGGIDADQYVTGQIVRSVNNLTNNVTLAAGNNITITPSGNTLTIAATGGGNGGNGINNQTSLQTSANFNIDGTGAADTFNAATQFNIGGNRVLSVKGGANLFAGANAGTSNTSGNSNTFVGNFAGNANTAGMNNAFFGTDAGRTNQGDNNSFFGRSSGFDTNAGSSNSFFGLDSGRFNQTGNNGAFFGRLAGAKSNADNNAFFGFQSGGQTTLGGGNAFFGYNAGLGNTIGANNTIIGNGANVGANNLTFATAIGAGAVVSTSNTVVLGRTADTVVAPNLLQVNALGATGNTTLCRNAANQIADCSAGTGSYINNATVQQANAFFNISGGGTLGGTLSANLVNSTTNYRIGGSIVLATPNATSVIVGPLSNYNLTAGNNAFFGYKAGAAADNTGQGNVFFGSEAGTTNSNGAGNSFVGRDAGFFNTSGGANSFFGNSAGKQNTTASFNSFFGTGSGISNTTGEQNSFFGFQSGQLSKTVNDNSFFGYQAGKITTGGQNTFIGSKSGDTNTTGLENTFVGYSSGAGGNYNIAIGAGAGGNGDDNTVVGTVAGGTGNGNTIVGSGAGGNGNSNTIIGYLARVTPFNASSPNPVHATAIGAGAVANFSHTVVLGTEADDVLVPGNLYVSKQFAAPSINTQSLTITGGELKLTTLQLPTQSNNKHLCLNGNSFVAICPEDVGNKYQNSPAFDKTRQESTDQIEAQTEQIKVQHTQIETQAAQIKAQQLQIEQLKQAVCALNPAAQICTVK